MFRRVAAIAFVALLGLGACTPITAYQGFQAVESNPKDVKVGQDTKSTVLERLGSPSAVAAFDTNTWFYITQVSDSVAFRRPNVRRRDVVAIAFAKEDDKVASVDSFGLKDGKVIPYNSRHTPTRGRELSVLEQLLGNIGQAGMLPTRGHQPGHPAPPLGRARLSRDQPSGPGGARLAAGRLAAPEQLRVIGGVRLVGDLGPPAAGSRAGAAPGIRRAPGRARPCAWSPREWRRWTGGSGS